MLGRPAICDPVCRNVTAGSWLMASVYADLIKVTWSATLAVYGISSLTHAPDWPCCWNANFEGTMGKFNCAEDMLVRRCPMRMEAGRSGAWKSWEPGL